MPVVDMERTESKSSDFFSPNSSKWLAENIHGTQRLSSF